MSDKVKRPTGGLVLPFDEEEEVQVRCNDCYWVGNESELIIDLEEDTERCPNCRISGYLMDMEREE